MPAEDSTQQIHHRCTVGHRIAPDQLLTQTELVSLDGGAEVRICSLHGAPITFEIERKGVGTTRDSDR